MLTLIIATMTASLLGSTHCAAMCGPLAIWASGTGEADGQVSVVSMATLYHLGRLAMYLVVGLLAGLFGSFVDVGGSHFGIQLAAARLAGGLMITIGVVKLIRMRRYSRGGHGLSIGYVLARLRPYVRRFPRSARAVLVGMLTSLLPCGWLYLFAIIAAGSGAAVMGAVVMGAFWLGTVPALTSLTAGAAVLSRRVVRNLPAQAIPALAAVTLVFAGAVTGFGRGLADLASLSELGVSTGRSAAEQVENASETLLPCCIFHRCEDER